MIYRLVQEYFNPHLPRGRWQYLTGVILIKQSISIHTFLAEGDRILIDGFGTLDIISIHTFLAEGDRITYAGHRSSNAFQSTPSSRKVTCEVKDCVLVERISIHTFLAEGDQVAWIGDYSQTISIHTFLAEGDVKLASLFVWFNYDFNPHLPRGRWPVS